MTLSVTDRVKEILSYYPSDNPGTLTNLARLLMHGRLAGTGRMVILPVDQGFEHGPYRSFGMNPEAMDPDYHIRLAIESGCAAGARGCALASWWMKDARSPSPPAVASSLPTPSS